MTRKKLASVLMLLTLMGGIMSAQVSAAEAPQEPQRAINTTGIGIVTATPDMATFIVGIVAHNEDLKVAQGEVTDTTNAIKAMLLENGVEEKDILTSSYQVQPQNKYDRNGNFVEVVGYDVQLNTSVTVRDIKLVGTLLDNAVTLGANYVSSINFSVADPTTYLQEARTMAMQDARQRAVDYATASDSTLTGLLSMYESSSPMPAAKSMMDTAGAPMVAADAQESNPVDVSAGTTQFLVRIETSWTIVPAGEFAPTTTPAN